MFDAVGQAHFETAFLCKRAPPPNKFKIFTPAPADRAVVTPESGFDYKHLAGNLSLKFLIKMLNVSNLL